MKFKRILSFVASAAMTISALCGAMSITASAATSGNSGGLRWWLSGSTLYVSVTSTEEGATSPMLDFTSGKEPWNSNSSKITKVVIKEGVTSVGNYAFYNYSKITEISLPSTITSIGDSAFEMCTALETLTLPETLPKIKTFGSNAFSQCKLQITDATFFDNATTIGASAFNHCVIASVSLKSVQTIQRAAFMWCEELTKVTFPSYSQFEIGEQAFYGCGFTSISIPSNAKTVGASAFADCKNLETASIPSSYTTIPDSLFENCTSLTSFKIPSNVTTIGKSAFLKCRSLGSIDIPSSVTTIGSSAFSGCSSLESISLLRGIKELGDKAFADCTLLDNIQLPTTITTLGAGVFSGCTTIVSLTIPGSVTEIPQEAFKGCSNLANIDIADSVETIGANAFQDCTSLKTIALPKNLNSVTGQAFVGCTSLTQIKASPDSTAFANSSNNSYSGVLMSKDQSTLIAYPSGLTSTSVNFTQISATLSKVGDYAFYNNTKVSSIGNVSIAEVGNYAFSGCTAISSLTFNASLVSIGNYAFDGCTKLSTISKVDGSSLATIGDYAFRNTVIKSIALNSNSVTLGNRVFSNCSKLATVTLNGATSIGDYAFEKCAALKTITLPDTLTSIGKYAFTECTILANVNLSKGLTNLSDYMFNKCAALKRVSIPSSVTSLGQYVFYQSGLEEITVPNSVTTMGVGVFSGCKTLKKAVISNQISVLSNYMFNICTDPDLEIYLTGTITSSEYRDVFGSGSSSYVKGTIYVYDEESYNKINNQSAVGKDDGATLTYGADFTKLRAYIAEAKALYEVDYTPESYSAIASVLTLAEITNANYLSTQGSADVIAANLRSAIDKLVPADNKEMLEKLAEVAADAENNYIRSDYRSNLYDDLRNAYRAGQKVTGEETNSELQKLIDDIKEAEDNLCVAYAYPDPVLAVKSGDYSNTFAYNLPAMSGVTNADIVGATQARITFDCASHVYFNSITEFHFHSIITRPIEEDPYYTIIDDNSANKFQTGGAGAEAGGKGYELTFDLVEPLQEGDAYNIYTYTYNWGTYPEYDQLVFLIREIELLDAEGNTLLSTKDVTVPNEDLLAAVDEAKAADTTGASAARVQALNDAVAAANDILEQELPLPSAMESAASAIRDAIKSLSEPSVDTKSLDEAIKNAEGMDTSKYTDESVAALQSAIESAKATLEKDGVTQEDINAAEKAISDAVEALKQKSDSSSNPPDSSNSSNSTNGGSTSTTAAPTTTANPAVRAAKDKADAQKLMNQAKITKLTVKSKAKKKITVNWKKVSNAKGYQVQVSKKSNFKKKSIFFNKFTSKKKLTVTKKLKSGKTYYVRVRAYATYKDANNVTKKVYSKWNKKLRKVKVK